MKISKKLFGLLMIFLTSICTYGSDNNNSDEKNGQKLSLEEMSQKGMLLKDWNRAIHDKAWFMASLPLSREEKIARQNKLIARARKTVEESEGVGFIVTEQISSGPEILPSSFYEKLSDDIEKAPSIIRLSFADEGSDVENYMNLRL